MNEICPINTCTGCSACANTCVHNAIKMEEDPSYGYLYPIINRNICVDCGLCVKVCPSNNPPDYNNSLTAFAAISKDYSDLMTSSSGAASSVLACHVVRTGGIVYGSIEDNYTHINHQRIDRLENLYKIKGSKYVHSYTTECYPLVKTDLLSGKRVLFFGTPCQVAGLIKYLRKSYDNLITVDLCCHGVPSQKFLRDDVESLWQKNKNKIGIENMTNQCESLGLYVTFRNKGDLTKPWDRYNVTIRYKGKDVLTSPFLKDNFITAFMSGHLFRENCYSCPYARAERVSDITIADFWGYKGVHIKTNDGISLLMPSTEKGIQLIEDCKEAFLYEERDVSEAIKGNGQFNHPSIRPIERDTFLKYYPYNIQKAYDVAIKDYVVAYKKRIFKDRIKRILKAFLLLK